MASWHEIIMIEIDTHNVNFRKMSHVFYFLLSEIADYFSIDISEHETETRSDILRQDLVLF